MPTDFAIVTAASAGYFGLLQGLLSSLSPLGRVPIHVLDLGLTPYMREELNDRGIATPVPGWDIKVPKVVRDRRNRKVPLPDTYRAFTAQPFLPRYVPDAEVLFWIDADAWVQDTTAVELYVSEARRGRLAISLELDRSYSAPYWRLKQFPDFLRSFGLRDAWLPGKKNTANVGVLAMKRDAPHWALWQSATQVAYRNFAHQRSQQMAMQYVIYNDRAPTSFLPASYNWQTWEAVPLFDPASGLLLEPSPPYHPLHIIHNAQEDKNEVYQVMTTEGGAFPSNMRYETWAPRRKQRARETA